MKIKALTVYQPWANLLAHGLKQYETRPRRTHYRGPLAIHAGLAHHPDVAKHWELFFKTVNRPLLDVPVRFGMVIAIAELDDCIEMTEEFISAQTATERLAGDWREGRFAWKIKTPRLITPIPYRGQQGLWNVEVSDDLLRGHS